MTSSERRPVEPAPGGLECRPPGGGAILMDEGASPSLREVLGRLLAEAVEADFAVARIRLAGIDLTAGEMAGVRRCRVLVGRLDADTFADAADAARAPGRRASLDALRAFLESGRVEVRAAGVDAWLPDFSILRGLPETTERAGGEVALVGAHYFARASPTGGPALTCLLGEPASARLASARFDELWARGYDVLPVLRDAVASMGPLEGDAP